MVNRLTNRQIGNVIRKIYARQREASQGYTKEQKEKNELLCEKFGDGHHLTANIYEVISQIKINNMKKAVKKVAPKKAVKKVAVKKVKKEEMPKFGIIQIDVKKFKKKRETTVSIDGVTFYELKEIFDEVLYETGKKILEDGE